jgi:hypothetical protein
MATVAKEAISDYVRLFCLAFYLEVVAAAHAEDVRLPYPPYLK